MTKPIHELISKIVKEAEAKHLPINELRQAWLGLVGRKLAAHTRPASLRKGKLVVLSDDPGASFLLDIEKHELLKKLNTKAGPKLEEIIIRSGEL